MNALALPDLAQAIEAEHQAAHQAAMTALEHALECGRLLLQAKAALPHGGWLPWLEANVSFGPRQAQKYTRLAERPDDIDQMRLENSHLTIDQALAALADKQPLRVHMTGAVEWYTPSRYLDCARQVLGEFDLDPASCSIAQAQVQARNYFTKDDDGLAQQWNGRIWCNPPYCDADKFVDKLLAELGAGRTTEAVFLVNAYCDTRWFHRAAAACAAICFTLGRIRFERPGGDPGQPPHGSALIYFGDQVDRFRAAFAGQGLIMIPDAGAAP